MQSTLLNRIEQVLDEKVRPSLAQHYGDVKVLSAENGVVRVQMTGQCGNCPSATLTVEQVIEKELVEALPEVERVLLVTQVSDDLLDLARSMLNHTDHLREQ